ncbi:uncharacterized protein Z520_00216 [Fonsecaea multimorphosa CBS 102226]|uniref:Uncharacterized protein n=1 Tax=Fonsecaea multimorphosa CBS 102226 TaxID=1442371 RepID=A0A0D2KJ63_9EURO|nr:uncharacterized protein Z520_00216 [Fonsecaea multimorphosa CBS 102226]KIY03525.1 hypothetical protein Z520_00216 [Fonsecaea multimorphosa CBS 102226]
MSPSLPPRPASPRTRTPQNTAVHLPGNRKIRPLVYAIGVAGIVASGAFIGAILKTDRQQEAARKSNPTPNEETGERVEAAEPAIAALGDNKVYLGSLEMLETKRAQLLGQKVALERKLQDFRESQRRRAEEERERKEFGLRR